MKAEELYQILEKDFIKPGLSDDWSQYMGEIEEFLSDNFKARSMGLVCDFASEINSVYSAVFPTQEVMEKILGGEAENAMLFVHHPSIWDIQRNPVFYQMPRDLLEKFKERKISIYNLHVPLDNYSEYSTSNTLADALGLKFEKPFASYFGSMAGVIGTFEGDVQSLKLKFEAALGHKSVLYDYGNNEIVGGRVAVVAGGGLGETIEEIAQNKINLLVTGITALTSHSQKNHDFAREHKINLLGGTHYSTEKFACQAMCKYFGKLGLSCEFIEGEPGMEDM